MPANRKMKGGTSKRVRLRRVDPNVRRVQRENVQRITDRNTSSRGQQDKDDTKVRGILRRLRG